MNVDRLLGFGDDALVAAQRLAEWHASSPEMEEDIALANIALDQLGAARLLLTYAGEVEGRGRDEDALAFLRDDREFRNCLLVELPNGDFATTMAKLLFLSAYQLPLYTKLAGLSGHENAGRLAGPPHRDDAGRLAGPPRREDAGREDASRADAGSAGPPHPEDAGLADSAGPAGPAGGGDAGPAGSGEGERLAAIAAKARKESAYHLDHSAQWTIRLGDGTEESHRRMQDAVDALWPYTHELTSGEVSRDEWLSIVEPVLAEATLDRPADGWAPGGGRSGVHTEHLSYLLGEMQVLHRAHPGARW
ncbi:phenylacetate-CoA oxygenase subunit PaaI [Phytohabitans sp. ZYX-F-186]|uniref:Phenylacetate-CoA oxygenase subunit PaaI n=1 Tax=Phytohabitans maris TaxID=3071409 RepID=A0ABU0ZMZ6_9ACTN|nr:phenylacetate-CoA oxygenase subunit PaaI [Phytohabitans sp. ZYX-F-186]MDQ7908414.1 phenylacetate-CoA oxygenase subunit PaaI [Phytohabitans sp. ZYX-F-186]